MAVLFSRHAQDEVVESLSRIAGARELETLAAEDMLAGVSCEVDNRGLSFLRGARPGAVVPDGVFLINRLFMNQKLFEQAAGDAVAAQTEIEAYFRQALSLTAACSSRPGMYALCGDYLPLFLQWKRASGLSFPLATPRYDYAFGRAYPEVGDFSSVVYKSPFDLRGWKPNSPPDAMWHTFSVERPKGVPVACAVLGDGVLFNPGGDVAIPDWLGEASVAIARLFGACFGEILYFINGESACFASFSHFISSTWDAARFDALLGEYCDKQRDAAPSAGESECGACGGGAR
ncbi:hypothetical protein B0T37_07360 [Chromobacterium violaceum]|nr:hypothetical protein B0T38_04715 [Chromobacterium violaceum]OQS27682.1 hypothetical protein B0T37_07360 [Chromobacterium violaceum]